MSSQPDYMKDEYRQALHNYVDYLTKARSKFETAHIGFESRSIAPEILDSARVMAHKIAGNALMYGYPALGDMCRDLENILLKAPVDQERAQYLCTKILSKIDFVTNHANNLQDTEFESETIEPDPTPDRWNSGSNKTGGAGQSGHLPSVLIIHSDPWIANLIAKMMQPDMDVQICDMAHNAMAEAVNGSPEIIILEEQLPDMSGVDITRFIRAIPKLKTIPIIMVMQSDATENIVSAVESGVTDCFEKSNEILPLVNHAKKLVEKKRYKVLVVDDDMAVRDILRHRFQTKGIRADVAIDGIEALEYLNTERPDLIILDRMMPRLEGGAVLYQIQQEINLKSIPVMLVTAMANREDAITWLKRGAIDYITKPFNPDEVVLRALRHLRIEDDAA